MEKRKLLLVVTADDLGYSDYRDDGILEAFQRGIVTSASLLVNGASARSAARRAKDAGIYIGLHLNLSEGSPVSRLEDVPLLLDASGKQMMRKTDFLKAAEAASQSLDRAHRGAFFDQVIAETKAQLELFKTFVGNYPSHVDGHQHAHIAEGIPEVIAPVLSSYGVKSTRIVDESVEALRGIEPLSPKRKRYERMCRMCCHHRAAYASHGIFSTSRFLGVGLHGKSGLTPEDILEGLRRQVPLSRHIGSSVELMVHPGKRHLSANTPGGCGNGIVDDFARSADREKELKTLCSPDLRRELEQCERISLVSWKKWGDEVDSRGPASAMQDVNVLLLAFGEPATGNFITALRIRSLLAERCNFAVTMLNTNRCTSDTVKDTIDRNSISIIVGLHAYHAGRVLPQGCRLPFIVVAGGTDLNCAIPERSAVIKNTLESARSLIVFNNALRQKAARHVMTSEPSRVALIPQAVDVAGASLPWIRQQFSLGDSDTLLLLPAGIRPVKDPLFLVSAFRTWAASLEGGDQSVLLVIIGGVRCEKTMNALCDALGESDWKKDAGMPLQGGRIVYHPPVPHPRLLSAIRDSDVVLNSSISEGMANSILEAMALETTVVARRNDGNADLVGRGNERGYLYDLPDDCISILDRLHSWPRESDASEKISRAASYIKERHSCENEARAYETVVRSALAPFL